MADSFEARGGWWLPERPDHKIPGILTFSPQSGGELSLLGNLRSFLEEGERTEKDGTVEISMTEAAMERAGTYPPHPMGTATVPPSHWMTASA